MTTFPNRRRALALIAFLLLLSPTLANAQSIKRITTASAVRVRSGPTTSAGVVDTLSIGVVLEELGRSDAPARIGEREDYWYRVALPGGKQGWVFGGLTRAVAGDQVEQAWVDVARERLARDADAYSFTDWADLVAFLGRVSGTARDRNLAGELELSRLLAISKALLAIPYEKVNDAPYKPWITAQGDTLVYHEFAGQWILKADVVWALQKRYANTPIAEQIAWEAARAILPGECEGYLPCHVASFNMTTGRYLELYPKGTHADEALDEALDLVRGAAEDAADGGENQTLPGDAEGREELRRELAKTRAILANVSGPKRDEALKLVERIEQAAK